MPVDGHAVPSGELPASPFSADISVETVRSGFGMAGPAVRQAEVLGEQLALVLHVVVTHTSLCPDAPPSILGLGFGLLEDLEARVIGPLLEVPARRHPCRAASPWIGPLHLTHAPDQPIPA
jgi:hypothetical protein